MLPETRSAPRPSGVPGTVCTMSVMNLYFSAPSDVDAVAAPPAGPGDAVFGVDPAVQLGAFAALLADRTAAETTKDADWARLVSDPEGPESWTVSLPDSFTAALAVADDDRLAALAAPWAQDEEFPGQADPDVLRDMLGELRTLAAGTCADGEHLYCLITL